MESIKKQRQHLAKAILKLHELCISTGEEKKPMTISLPDMAQMAELPEDITENIMFEFIGEKIINVENSAVVILDKKALKKIA